MSEPHFLPPEEFVPCPQHGAIFEVKIAIGWDMAALVIEAPEAFMEWERDKEGSVCNPEVFFRLPVMPGVHLCRLRFEIDLEDCEVDSLYMYRYVCEDARKIA